MPQPLANAPKPASPPSAVEKHLTFRLDSEEFAVPVAKVREIIGWQEITPLPQTPPYVRGVINLRGKVVPVVDLRRKLAVPETECHARTCIVVLEIDSGAGFMHTVGAVVDGVSEVISIQAADLENREHFSHGLIQAAYIRGIAKIRGKLKVLLDVDRVLGSGVLAG